MAADGERGRMLARTTPGRCDATLDADERYSPNHQRAWIVSQVRITKQRRTAAARWRRQREPVLPLKPRDPDITRAKHLQRQRAKPGAGGLG